MPDLSQAFGRPASARGSSALAGMLGPKPSRPAPRAEEDPEPEAPEDHAESTSSDNPPMSSAEVDDTSSTDSAGATTQEVTLEPRATAPSPRRPKTSEAPGHSAGREIRQAPAAQDDLQTHQTIVYISAQAKAAAERRRGQLGCTNAELVFDALDDAHERLQELLDERLVHIRPSESLFPSRRITRRASSTSTRRVSFSFRPTGPELQVIQDLVRDYKATSVSELVAVAMDHHLLRGRRR